MRASCVRAPGCMASKEMISVRRPHEHLGCKTHGVAQLPSPALTYRTDPLPLYHPSMSGRPPAPLATKRLSSVVECLCRVGSCWAYGTGSGVAHTCWCTACPTSAALHAIVSASLKVKVWAVAGLTALTLLHHSECSSVTDDGMRAVAIDQSDPHRECWHTGLRA